MPLKDQTSEDPTNCEHSKFDKATSSASSDASDIIYTPPSSLSSMSSISNPAGPSQPSGTANISIREYIYFLPYPLPPHTPVPYSIHLPAKNPLNLPSHQFEPTSTLVLTSPNNTFIDIRLFKPTKSDQTPLPNKGERDRLEWGFAGTSASTPVPDPNTPPGEEPWEGVTHSKWVHWVDSRFPVGCKDIPVDEGLMYPIDSNLTLEHGHAYHPHLKAVKSHEEMWRDVAVTSTSTAPAGKKLCVVLRLQNDAAGARGLVVRLGQYCQGIVMLKGYASVERWEYDDTKDSGGEEAGWKRTAKIGDQFLPCAVTWREDILKVGGRINYADYEWDVEEAWEWFDG